MHETGLLLALGAVFAFTLVAKRLAGSVLTAPMLFLGVGWLLGSSGVLHVEGPHESVFIVAEITLVILLFTDAAAIDPKQLLRDAARPVRMLLIGLPLTIGFGTLAGFITLPGWPFWEVALLAAILAPTDAALGQAVVTDPRIPERVRRTLTVESGLNDGLALPAVLLFCCLAVEGAHDDVQTTWWRFAAEQIGLGLLAGAVIGVLGGAVMRFASDRGLSSDAFAGVGVLALAGLAYFCAVEIGGNGFLAAFAGGLAFGRMMAGRCPFVHEFLDADGQVLIYASFLLIGFGLLPDAIEAVHPAWLVLIALSLFVVRPAAIALSLAGSGTPWKETAFYGWFGPRGLATALFALLAIAAFDRLALKSEILAIAVLTVAISAVLHGASAALAGRMAGPLAAAPDPDAAETGPDSAAYAMAHDPQGDRSG